MSIIATFRYFTRRKEWEARRVQVKRIFHGTSEHYPGEEAQGFIEAWCFNRLDERTFAIKFAEDIVLHAADLGEIPGTPTAAMQAVVDGFAKVGTGIAAQDVALDLKERERVGRLGALAGMTSIDGANFHLADGYQHALDVAIMLRQEITRRNMTSGELTVAAQADMPWNKVVEPQKIGTRLATALGTLGVRTVRDLTQVSDDDLKRCKGIGVKLVANLAEAMRAVGLTPAFGQKAVVPIQPQVPFLHEPPEPGGTQQDAAG